MYLDQSLLKVAFLSILKFFLSQNLANWNVSYICIILETEAKFYFGMSRTINHVVLLLVLAAYINQYPRMMQWIWDWAKYHNSHRSISINLTKLYFCQNDVLQGRSFLPKDSLVTFTGFELWLLWYLVQSQIYHIIL